MNIEQNEELELRMYFFVISSLQGISKGIQCGHAALEYANKYGNTELFQDFVNNWKTWIVLNGGTTNSNRDLESIPFGSLNKIGDELQENDVEFSFFFEPDLNDALTALCFIVDERVFNYKKYPHFYDFILSKMSPEALLEMSSENELMLRSQSFEKQQEIFPDYYKEWVRLIGGVKNVFLRQLIMDKKLA